MAVKRGKIRSLKKALPIEFESAFSLQNQIVSTKNGKEVQYLPPITNHVSSTINNNKLKGYHHDFIFLEVVKSTQTDEIWMIHAFYQKQFFQTISLEVGEEYQVLMDFAKFLRDNPYIPLICINPYFKDIELLYFTQNKYGIMDLVEGLDQRQWVSPGISINEQSFPTTIVQLKEYYDREVKVQPRLSPTLLDLTMNYAEIKADELQNYKFELEGLHLTNINVGRRMLTKKILRLNKDRYGLHLNLPVEIVQELRQYLLLRGIPSFNQRQYRDKVIFDFEDRLSKKRILDILLEFGIGVSA